MHDFDNMFRLIQAIAPVIVFLAGILFNMGQSRREELSHSLDSALKRLRAGEIDAFRAKELVLATGAVSEYRIDRVLDEVQLRIDGNKLDLYRDNVIPGVGVAVDSKGDVRVDPTGVMNKLGHKPGKRIKNKTGFNLF